MASRTELTRQFMQHQQDREIDKTIAMLADDVVSTNPLQGTMSGKAAVEASMRAGPPGGGGGAQLTWSEPQEAGDTVTILGSGSPFGTIKVVITFNASDQISRIEAGLA